MCLYYYLSNGQLILIKKIIISVVLLDLSKAFDCTPRDLLIAKLNAYRFDSEALKLIYSYLKGKKQSLRINNIYDNFLELLSGDLKGSILEALLFNIFLKALFFFITKAFLYIHADDIICLLLPQMLHRQWNF